MMSKTLIIGFFFLCASIGHCQEEVCQGPQCLETEDDVSLLQTKVKSHDDSDVHFRQQAPEAGHDPGGSEDPDPDSTEGTEHPDSEVSTEHPEELLQKDSVERMNSAERMNAEARQVQAMVKDVREGKSKSLNLLQLIDLVQKAYTPRSDYTSEELIEATKGLDVNNNGLLEKEELTATYVTEADANSTKISSTGWSWKAYTYDDQYGYLRSSIDMYFVPHVKLPDGLTTPKQCFIFADSAMFWGNSCWSKYTYTNLHNSQGTSCRCFGKAQTNWKLYYSGVGNRIYKNYP